jgi:hypothetical protein
VQALAAAKDWCDVLVLPFNVQKCEAKGDALEHLHRAQARVAARRRETPRSHLRAARAERRPAAGAPRGAHGPAGTKDYRIVFEATPLDERRTLVHMGYGYGYGAMSSLVMQSYLATSGKDKVGFTTQGTDEDGKPRLVGGMRGVMERNTMR